MSLTPPAISRDSASSVPHRRVVAGAMKGRPDDRFFSAMAVVVVGTVFLGFARTYYLAGIYHAHLRNRLIEVHGAAFTAWILLLVVQVGLVARRHVALHRRLGVFGAALAVAMVGLGLAAATGSLTRGFIPPGFPFGPRVFYARPILAISTFATLVGAAVWMRRNAAAHKRLMLLATLALVGAAVGRWPFDVIHRVPALPDLIVDAMVLSIAAFDWWSLRRIHRATIAGGLFLVLLVHLAIPLGLTPAWQRFAAFAQQTWQGWP
jgi:hypothetical protein